MPSELHLAAAADCRVAEGSSAASAEWAPTSSKESPDILVNRMEIGIKS